MKRTSNDTLEDDIAIDDIRTISRQLEIFSDEGPAAKDGTLHLDSREEIQSWVMDASTVEIARTTGKPLTKITREVKERLKTIIREMGV